VIFSRSIFLLVPSLLATQVVAQTEMQLERDAREIFETVLSPYCPGRTISNCPSPQADELRHDIKQQLAAGETPEEVKEELYTVFGDELRTIPRAQGFGLLAWVVPGMAFALGGWAVIAWVRRSKTAQRTATEPEVAQIDPELDARLAAEMAELD
jgi:cytochrome c-type biogenesis protein CcmH